ncbi:Metallo-dependent phosphatase-like protein [Dichotomocladium elegans]|nr:Metallo-dependent phosphatase-like protein [Dichotomocladium elegans]
MASNSLFYRSLTAIREGHRPSAVGVVATVFLILVLVTIVSSLSWTQNEESHTIQRHDRISRYANLIRLRTIETISGYRRLFAMGDIHGCLQDFDALLKTMQYSHEQGDRLILLGDLTSKGPDSLGVIRRAAAVGAWCVRGNHDDKVIRIATFLRHHSSPLTAEGRLPEGPVPDPIRWNTKKDHVKIARELTDTDYDYLAGCPLIIQIPSLLSSFVHAGLDPRLDYMDEQDAYNCMNMRSIGVNGVPVKQKLDGMIEWSDAWNKIRSSSGEKVYYGHAASSGLRLKNLTFGLDTGCVNGGQLTAMEVLSGQLYQVPCHIHDNQI